MTNKPGAYMPMTSAQAAVVAQANAQAAAQAAAAQGSSGSSMLPILLIGGLAVGVFWFIKRRRKS